MNTKLLVVTEMSVAAICLITEQVASREFFLGALSPFAVLSLSIKLSSSKHLPTFSIHDDCYMFLN